MGELDQLLPMEIEEQGEEKREKKNRELLNWSMDYMLEISFLSNNGIVPIKEPKTMALFSLSDSSAGNNGIVSARIEQ